MKLHAYRFLFTIFAITYLPLPVLAQDMQSPAPANQADYLPMPGEEIPDDMMVAAEPPAGDVIAAPPLVNDPLAACRESHEADIESCLNRRMAASDDALAAATAAAQAAAQSEGTAAVRALTSSNMAFNAFRDAECLRQRMALPDEGAAHIAKACRIILNDMRGLMLQR